MNYEQFLKYAKSQIDMTKEMATSKDELAELLTCDQLWLEGYAAGLYAAGTITKYELSSSPVDITQLMK